MNNTAEDEKQTQQIDIMGEQLPIIW
jgi:hypothetical protein